MNYVAAVQVEQELKTILEEVPMSRLSMLCGAAALSTLSLIPAAAFAQEGGPCTDDIAKLRRELSTQVGMGAPVSEPDYGQRKGPNEASDQKSAGTQVATSNQLALPRQTALNKVEPPEKAAVRRARSAASRGLQLRLPERGRQMQWQAGASRPLRKT